MECYAPLTDWDNEADCMIALKQDGYDIQVVDTQTLALCIQAVKTSAYAIQHCKFQTKEMALIAVNQSAFALCYVRRQTPDICIAACKNDPKVYKKVKRNIKNSKKFKQFWLEHKLKGLA